MEASTPGAHPASRPSREPQPETVPDYCWRPSCRKPFLRPAGRGRPKAYCSDICRRAAQKEARQARSRLAHFEALVEKLRIDVAAFGKPDPGEAGDDSDERPPSLDARQAAENAVRRAAGALVFANPDDLAVRELKLLHDTVAPIILGDTAAG